METMRPSGPVKLESIESGLYKEVSTISHKNHVQYKFNSGIESWSIALHNYQLRDNLIESLYSHFKEDTYAM